MAISNSLTKSKRNTSLAAYLTQEAVKNQISNSRNIKFQSI